MLAGAFIVVFSCAFSPLLKACLQDMFSPLRNAFKPQMGSLVPPLAFWLYRDQTRLRSTNANIGKTRAGRFITAGCPRRYLGKHDVITRLDTWKCDNRGLHRGSQRGSCSLCTTYTTCHERYTHGCHALQLEVYLGVVIYPLRTQQSSEVGAYIRQFDLFHRFPSFFCCLLRTGFLVLLSGNSVYE